VSEDKHINIGIEMFALFQLVYEEKWLVSYYYDWV